MRFTRRIGRRGLTLLEVMAGIALLSTLLVGVLMSFGGLAKQVTRAAKLSEAVEVADGLLASWYASESGVPLDARGTVGSFVWRTSVVDEELLPLGLVVVRLSVEDEFAENEELMFVDVLVAESHTSTALSRWATPQRIHSDERQGASRRFGSATNRRLAPCRSPFRTQRWIHLAICVSKSATALPGGRVKLLGDSFYG